MGPVVERIRNEERQKEVQGLHNVYKTCYACYLTSAKKVSWLAVFIWKTVNSKIYYIFLLLLKRLTAYIFDYLEIKFFSKDAIKIKSMLCFTICHSII